MQSPTVMAMATCPTAINDFYRPRPPMKSGWRDNEVMAITAENSSAVDRWYGAGTHCDLLSLDKQRLRKPQE